MALATSSLMGQDVMAAKPKRAARKSKAAAKGASLNPQQRAWVKQDAGTLLETLWHQRIQDLKIWLQIFNMPDCDSRDDAVAKLFAQLQLEEGATEDGATETAAADPEEPEDGVESDTSEEPVEPTEA